MSLVMPKPPEQHEFELTPSGTHVATCFQVIDLGTQLVEYNGTSSLKRQVRIAWELPEELMKDGRPFSVNKKYKLSSFVRAPLRLDLQQWRGRDFTDEEFGTFDLGKLIGASCLIAVVHAEGKKEGSMFANVGSVSKLAKGMASPPLINEPIYFSLNDFKQEVYDKLSEYLRMTIAKSPEFMELEGVKSVPSQAFDEEEAQYRQSQMVPF